MPIVSPSTYVAPSIFRLGHVSTIVPSLLRRVRGLRAERERLELPDGDFLDLDWLREPSSAVKPGGDRLLILSHGLEGNSRGQYIHGMARAFLRTGWETLAWNFRGCGGEPNRLLRMYHSGVSDDLGHVVTRALREKRFQTIVLAGFSMGGNITLKYLGEGGARLDKRIRAAVTFSVPCDLEASCYKLALPANRVYMTRFLTTLRQKMKQKARQFPGRIDLAGIEKIREFQEFDERYTGPLHGFDGALHYYRSQSSKNFLARIRVPTLLVNALDDPFLAPPCFPYEIARRSKHFFFESPVHGGHVGFWMGRGEELWSEARALEFVNGVLLTPPRETSAAARAPAARHTAQRRGRARKPDARKQGRR